MGFVHVIISGKRAILEAIYASHPVSLIVMSDSLQIHNDVDTLLQEARRQSISIQTLPAPQFKQRYPHDTQGIIAQSRAIQTVALDTVSDPTKSPSLLILDHLEDPHNVGAIIRTAEALGINGVNYSKDRQVKMTSGVIKASSGAVFHVPLIEVTNIGQAIMKLKQWGYWIYGTSLENAQPIDETPINSPFALVIGNEHKGISNRISKMVDLNIFIPMVGKVSSLNVSVATGILINHMIKRPK